MLPDVVVVSGGSGPSLLEQVLQVFALVGPLVGVWLGAKWTHRGGDESWRRDRRLDVYTRLSAALAEVEDGVSDATSYGTHAERQNVIDRLTGVLGRLAALRSEVALVAPDQIVDLADEAIQASTELLTDLVDVCERSPEGAAAASPDARKALFAHIVFVRGARATLESSEGWLGRVRQIGRRSGRRTRNEVGPGPGPEAAGERAGA